MALEHFSSFPDGFLWGASTSAYQIEGSWDQGGKGLSIWDIFSHQPEKTYQGHNGDQAADHYKRWVEDVALMSELGLSAYRFSTSWSRVLPTGSGQVNPRGLDFYDRLVDALLDHNIQPFLTLYHWDLPQALQELGGWANRGIADRFAEYATVMARRLGDRVNYWITHNEPLVIAMSGHLLGEHAPGIQNPVIALQAGHHLLLSHGLAVAALRSNLPAGAQVGITLNLNPIHPASSLEKYQIAAQRADALMNGLFLDPLYRGRYPDELGALYGPLAPAFTCDEAQLISQPLDFLGINYYSRVVVKHDPDSPLGQITQVHPEGNDYSQMWEIYPPGLSELLEQVWNRYRPVNMIVTENGVPVPDGIDFDGKVRDYRRIRYLKDHIAQVHQAISAGVPVRGYFVWSLLDNFEWSYGYQMRFGLVYVDFETKKRIIKESGRWYTQVIRENGVDESFRLPGC